jgi:hypothetical protein
VSDEKSNVRDIGGEGEDGLGGRERARRASLAPAFDRLVDANLALLRGVYFLLVAVLFMTASNAAIALILLLRK